MDFYPFYPAYTAKRLFMIIAIVVALLLFAAPTFAQVSEAGTVPAPTETPSVVFDEPPATKPPLIDVQATVETLFSFGRGLIESALQTAGLWPVVVLVVGILKFVPPVKKRILEGQWSVELIVFFTALAVWIGAAIAGWFGYDDELASAATWFLTVAPQTIQFLAVLFGAKWLHELAAYLNIPVAGKKLTPDVVTDDSVEEVSYTVHTVDDKGNRSTTSYQPWGSGPEPRWSAQNAMSNIWDEAFLDDLAGRVAAKMAAG